MRPIHYEMDTSLVSRLIFDKQDFFLGGRGVGIRFYPMSSGSWELEIERARVTIHADTLDVNGDLLEVFDEGGENLIARIDLKHYLKITVIW